jgi:sn-glycerol 3-phosphate transport system ATP-binding protein
MSLIELRGVTKRYGKNPPVIENMDLTVESGSFTVLLGPSGCGKSTVLRIIAGLERINGGGVKIGGRDMDGVDPGGRGVAMVFQNYALYPAMTVRENMEFGLKNMKIPKAERESRIAECARIVDLEPFLNRKPKSLSGGQRQRVALARAIVI